MDDSDEPQVPLTYARDASYQRLRPADVVLHSVFAIGTGLLAGAIVASINYNWAGIFYEWRPHLAWVGGTMVGLVVSFRMGPVLGRH